MVTSLFVEILFWFTLRLYFVPILRRETGLCIAFLRLTCRALKLEEVILGVIFLRWGDCCCTLGTNRWYVKLEKGHCLRVYIWIQNEISGILLRAHILILLIRTFCLRSLRNHSRALLCRFIFFLEYNPIGENIDCRLCFIVSNFKDWSKHLAAILVHFWSWTTVAIRAEAELDI